MGITLAIETPLQDDVRRLVGQLNDYLLPLCPVEYQWKMTVEEMAGPETTLLVVRDEDGAAVGMGALRTHTPQMGEVKRMWVDPAIRGKRIGSTLLAAIEDMARNKGLSQLLLETGALDCMEEAHRLYRRAGFVQRGPFLDYPDSPYSTFYEKPLTQHAVA